jgi:ZIP family zinc transporter
MALTDAPQPGAETVRLEKPRAPGWSSWLMALVPLLALLATLAVLVFGRPLAIFVGAAPPVEALSVRHIVLDDQGIRLEIVNSGPDPVTIAQVLVDDAYWNYSFEQGDGELGRLETATLRIPYPWVAGEAHSIAIVSRNGVRFPVEIPVAVATPRADASQLGAYALLGIYVGILPIVLGLLWYPFLRILGRRWMNFVLALTVGLLVFLAVDTLLEALEIAGDVPGVFRAGPLVYLITLLSFLSILAVGHASGRPQSRLFLSYLIALGIGFHNLGEGLAVGAAYALGQASLGAFLVIGFTLHNLTEGIGIAAPIAKQRPAVRHFAALALLAGGPAIAGTLLGGFAFDPLVAVIFLGIGAGAILQVIYEVGRLILESARQHEEPLLAWPNLAGLVAGIVIMYATALLVA